MIITTKKTFKYRIYPTKSQTTNLENQFSMCRHLYNWNLGERIEAYRINGETVTYRDQQNQLPDLKKEKPWYKGVYSQVLQDVLKRLDNAYQAFFRRVKEGEAPGFPKFKKRGQWDSITYPQFRDFPKDGTIRVPKVGEVKITYHREIPQDATIKTLTIAREGGKWFACFSVEVHLDIEPKQDLSNSIGIDAGLIDFAYASDGYHVQTPRCLRKSEKKLARLQKKFANAEKRSKKWRKLLRAIQNCHCKIRNQRNDFLHKTANEILGRADLICCEELNVQGMSRRPKPVQDESGKYLPNRASIKAGLNKSINDAGWRKFFSLLTYKAIEQGKKVLFVSARNTSQECSSCGEIVKKSLSVRTHECSCGLILNRDQNAALNILRVGLDALQATA